MYANTPASALKLTISSWKPADTLKAVNVSINNQRGIMRSRGLQPKHLKALELLAKNNKTVPEVAKECGMNSDTLYKLMVGAPSARALGQDFSEAFNKVMDEIQKETDAGIKKLRHMIIKGLSTWAENRLLEPDKLTKDDRKQVVDILNALSKATPVISIGSLSYSRGLSPEDLTNDFKRLTALAESALDGRAVPSVKQGKQRVLLASIGAGDPAQEEQEASTL